MMSVVDVALIVTYLLLVLSVGVWAGFRQNLEGFWVNRRRTRTALLVFTVVSAKIGAGATIGAVSAAYETGIGFPLVAAASTSLGYLLTAWISPYIRRFGELYSAFTLSEFFGVRYGRAAQVISASVILITYLSFLASQFVAAAALLSLWSGWAFELALVLAFFCVVAYSSVAGLRGSIIADAVHFWMMALVFFVIMVPAAAGEGALLRWGERTHAAFWSPDAFAGYTFLIGGILFGAVIGMVSMELWMRIYAAVGERQAQRTFVWSAFVVVPFFAAATFFGFVARLVLPELPNPDGALFQLMIRILPTGLLGLGIAALLAILVSTANTMIVVASATVFRDLLPRRAQGTGSPALRRSRVVTLGVGCLGLLLALALPDVVQLVLNAFFMIAVLSPALVAGIFWRRTTHVAAAASIALGALTTLAFLPYIPRQAFVPGLLVASVALVVIALRSSHAVDEQVDLGTLLRRPGSSGAKRP